MVAKIMNTLPVMLMVAAAAHAADMVGSSDHPSLPRVSGSEVLGYAFSDYDAGSFLEADTDGKVTVRHVEGKRTRILYLAKPGDTPLKVQKNYAAALADLGEVEERYSCTATECSNHIIATTLWTRDTMLPTEGVAHPFYLLGFAHNFVKPGYRYARVTTDQAQFHVGVLVAEIASNNANKELHGRTVALLEVLEVADFEATLEFVDAEQMRSEISSSGHVSLYGILFEHNEATLRAASDPTLAEVAALLANNASMKLYVVGHTDDVGPLDYNQDLSLRRAVAVTDALVSRGVARERLTPLGAGPMAPVASNATDNGRALNRRVELVSRLGGK